MEISKSLIFLKNILSLLVPLFFFFRSKAYLEGRGYKMKKSLGFMSILAFLFAVTLGAQAPVNVRAQLSQIYISDNFTFSGDLNEPIVVTVDNIVIDGNGFTLQGPGYGFEYYGIHIGGRSNIIIKNVTIRGWLYGIWLLGSYNNRIVGNTITINKYGIGFEGSANFNSISDNIIIDNGEDGIVFSEGSSVYNSISDNIITNNEDWGIYFDRSSNYTSILNNTITHNEAGIGLEYSSYNIISGNTITNNDGGIALAYSSHNSIDNNTITNNQDTGIWFYSSSNNNINDNTITNTATDQPPPVEWMAGISLLEESSNNVIYHNNIINNRKQAHDTNPATNNWHHPELLEGNYWSDYPGVDDGSGTGKHAIAGDCIGDTNLPWPSPNFDAYPFVQESGWVTYIEGEWPIEYITFTEDRYEPIVVTIDNLVIDGNGYTLQGPGSGTGIYIDERYNVTIKNLRVTGWDEGFNMGADSSYVTLTNNTIANNLLGVYMRMFCSDITIFNNAISHNEDGIHMEYCSRVNIANNYISHNHLGVRMWPPIDVTIVNNDIVKNYDGIHMVYSSNVTIFNNLIFWNDNNGVYMENCSDITVFMNVLIENFNHVYDNKANHFDNSTHGNYWIDYTGADTNGDGIGDTPYLIDSDSIDNYPLIHHVKIFPVAPSSDFTYSPSDPSIEDVIAFMDTSIDPDGTITSWEWDFGDETTSMEQNPTHQYADKGDYTIRLTVIDNDGLTSIVEQTIKLRNLPPTASFTHSPVEPTVGEDILFSDASSDPERQPITAWIWDFGDGATSTEENPMHAYETSGSYPVTLTVTDDEGLEDTFSTTVEVKPTEEEGVFIPGFTLEIGILAAIALFGLRKRQQAEKMSTGSLRPM